MATHFAQQRPCKGMAGFKFRTRTKSKYERPKPQSFIQQMTQQLEDKKKESRGRSSNAAQTKKQAIMESGMQQQNGEEPSMAISIDDLKKFFLQLSESASELNRGSHKRTPLAEQIDFKKDISRARLAVENMKVVLGQAAIIKLRQMAEDGDQKQSLTVTQPAVSEIPVSTQLSAIGHSDSNPLISQHGSAFVRSPNARRNTNSFNEMQPNNQLLKSAIASGNSDLPSCSANNLNSRQQLRLSVEGILDIVTEQQYLDADVSSREKQETVTPGLPKDKKSLFGTSNFHGVKMRRNPSEAKGMTILSPILAENSEYKQHCDSSPEHHEDASSGEPQTAPHLADYQHNPVSPILPHLVSPDLQELLSKKKNLIRNLQEALSQKSSKMSQRSVQSGKRQVFCKRTSTSQDHNGLSMTPRMIEPRCDNEDLKMISENQKDTEGNEFDSKLVQKGDGSDAERRVIDLNVGAIEMKLTHHQGLNSASRFKRRLKSAGHRKQLGGNYTGRCSSLVGGSTGLQADQPDGRNHLAIRTNASNANLAKGSLPDHDTARAAGELSSIARQEESEQLKEVIKHRYVMLKNVKSEESWVQNIDLNPVGEINKTKRAFHQINTLMLSDKSLGTTMEAAVVGQQKSGRIELAKVAAAQLIQTTPSVGQLFSKPGTNLESDKPLKQTTQTVSGVLIQQADQKQLNQEQLIEAEIQKIKENLMGQCGTSPQLAFVDQNERSLRFLQDTMKQHFLYTMPEPQNALLLGRPILSTRMTCKTLLSQQVQEEKILETLKSNNHKERYNEFRTAQKIALVMMDIVSTSNQDDMILELQEGAGSLTLTKDMLCGTSEKGGTFAEKLSLQQTLNLDGNTIDLLSQTGKSSKMKQYSLSRQTPGIIPWQINLTSPINRADKLKERRDQIFRDMQIEVRDEVSLRSRSPIDINQDVLGLLDSSMLSLRPQIVPTKLDINMQENVSNNIASHNQKIVENRKKMAERRSSRPDTLNQLVSPREHFEMTHRSYTVDKLKLINTMSEQQRNLQRSSCRSPPNADLPSCNSTLSQYDNRKVQMHAQGGGFNRSPYSGYFKGKRRSDIQQQSSLSPQANKLKQKASPTKPVVVEQRPQILANEVWQAQNRGMPYKVVLSVQKAPQQVVDPGVARANMLCLSERSISPKGAHGEFLGGDQTHIEVFPFNKQEEQGIASDNHQAMLNSLEPNVTNPRNTVDQHNNTSQEVRQPMLSASNAESQLCLKLRQDKLVSSHGEFNQPYLSSINEQFSEGQQTASNAIVQFRYSKQSKQSKITYKQESTTRLLETVLHKGSQAAMDDDHTQSGSKANIIVDETERRMRNNVKRSQELMINHRNHLKMLNSMNEESKLLAQSPDGEDTFLVQKIQNIRPGTAVNGRDSSELRPDGSLIHQLLRDGDVTSAEAIKTQAELLDHCDADIVRIGADQTKDKDEKFIVATTPSCEATDGPQRRSVLQKGVTVKASPQAFDLRQAATADMIQGGYRVRLTPTSYGIHSQVLVQDLKQQDDQDLPSNEAIDSETPDEHEPTPIFEDRNFEDANDQSINLSQSRCNLQQTSNQMGESIKQFEILTEEQRGRLAISDNHMQLVANKHENDVLTLKIWQPSDQQQQQQRPMTTKAQSRVITAHGRMIQASASQSNGQVLHRNIGTMSQKTWQGQTSQGGKSFTKSSRQNLSAINNTQDQKSQNGRYQAVLDGRQRRRGQTRSDGEPQKRAFKKSSQRLTFTQGVSQLIRNFDKKFIVDNIALPQPFPNDLVQTQQKEIVHKQSYTRTTPFLQEPNKDKVIYANIPSQLKTVPSIKETVTRTLTQDVSELLDSPSAKNTVRSNGTGKLTYRTYLARSKSKPVKSSKTGRSPIVQKTFDADDGLGQTQVRPTVIVSPSHPIYAVIATNAGNSVPNKMNLVAQVVMGEKASLNSQTTIETMHHRYHVASGIQKPNSPVQSKRAFSQQGASQRTQKRRPKKDDSLKHPLEFLAHAAVMSTKDVMSSRNDGLIIHDRRKYHQEAENNYAMSETAQNIAININCSRIRSQVPEEANVAQTTIHQKGQSLSELGKQPKCESTTAVTQNTAPTVPIASHRTEQDYIKRHENGQLGSAVSTQSIPFSVSGHNGNQAMHLAANSNNSLAGDYQNLHQRLKQSASMSGSSFVGGTAVRRSTLQRLPKNAVQSKLPAHILKQYQKNVHAPRVTSSSGGKTGRLSLTQNDIETLFKDLRQVQKKSLNQSSAMLCGTQIHQLKNPTQDLVKTSRASKSILSSGHMSMRQPADVRVAQHRRAQSSNYHHGRQQHKENQLFRQTVEGIQMI